MKYDGQNISSNTTNLTIDFRASNNSANILNCLKDLHTTKKRETERTSIAKSKIFYENGAIYISMLSNLCDRPLKFLIDTGHNKKRCPRDKLYNQIIWSSKRSVN